MASNNENDKSDTPIGDSVARVLQRMQLTPPPDAQIEIMPEEGEISNLWQYAPMVAHIADATTAYGMRKAGETSRNLSDAVGAIGGQRPPSYGHEKNPLMRTLVDHPLLNIPLKAGLGYLSGKASNWVAKKTGSRTGGKVVAAVSTIPPAVGTYTNVRQIVKANKASKDK
jgi:hypothetical protein